MALELREINKHFKNEILEIYGGHKILATLLNICSCPFIINC